ncbi:hypothetical protein [Thermomonas aquatica]|uniref:Uncharacterized protein n=1 Tax=Thermomonas aquatica TaxID=2202149 RepID=A0A5B7ZLY2_9GAMM|nr:hypothetical protein [Thermomonas aquatica]QDA56131.1 hypothetical protein FHQ07_01720 [Thermomonas aquatica]
MLYLSKSAAAAARASALRKQAAHLPVPLSYDRAGHRERDEQIAFMLRQAAYWDREASRLADAGL